MLQKKVFPNVLFYILQWWKFNMSVMWFCVMYFCVCFCVMYFCVCFCVCFCVFLWCPFCSCRYLLVELHAKWLRSIWHYHSKDCHDIEASRMCGVSLPIHQSSPSISPTTVTASSQHEELTHFVADSWLCGSQFDCNRICLSCKSTFKYHLPLLWIGVVWYVDLSSFYFVLLASRYYYVSEQDILKIYYKIEFWMESACFK